MPTGVTSSAAPVQFDIDAYTQADDRLGLLQLCSTMSPFAGLWWLASLGPATSYLLSALATLGLSLFLLRVFVLMHECGHGSLFRTPTLNRGFGFVLGVLAGMPQYVWARHHNYHHATNGNWARYRGPLAILSVQEFAELCPKGQRAYVRARRLVMAPIAGFVYLILNPRLTWMRGSLALMRHLLRSRWAQPGVSWRHHAAMFRTPYWASSAEYWHMTLNNLVLLSLWTLMCWLIGPLLFFTVYLISTSLAGAGGIVLFTVQHNFEHSYASCDQNWDQETAAIHGTSYLDLPGWLNWFTASIGYHHVHHLSARIPNYRLASCHARYAAEFSDVRRLRVRDVQSSLKYLLWDADARRIISVAEYRQAAPSAAS